jgi:hypothetical protein
MLQQRLKLALPMAAAPLSRKYNYPFAGSNQGCALVPRLSMVIVVRVATSAML